MSWHAPGLRRTQCRYCAFSSAGYRWPWFAWLETRRHEREVHR